MRSWRLPFVAASAGTLALAVLAGSPAAAAPHTYTIVIDKMKFGAVPANLHKGDTIIWANRDFIQHSATAADHSFDHNLPPVRRGRLCSRKLARFRSSAATIRACAAFSASNELKHGGTDTDCC